MATLTVEDSKNTLTVEENGNTLTIESGSGNTLTMTTTGVDTRTTTTQTIVATDFNDVYKGVWTSGSDYDQGDIVRYEERLYVAKLAITGSTTDPQADTTFWTEVVDPRGAISGTTGIDYDVETGQISVDSTIASKTYVDTAVSNIVDTAPAALDTLNELAAALNDDANFATTVNTSIAAKLNTADFTSTADSWLGTKDTDDITEGTTNQFYTDEKVDDRVNTLLQAGSGIALSYDDAANTLTITSSGAGGYDLSGNTTDDLAEGTTNLYYTSTRANTDFDTRLATKDTDDITEGSNLYFTQARFDTAFGNKDTDNLSEGLTNLYYTSTRANTDFDTRLATKDTDNLSEGISNLYYTTARFDARLATKSTTDITEGTNLYFTNERVDDRVSSLIQAGTNITTSYDDVNNTFTINASGGITDLSGFDTGDLTEGSNLYYTGERVDDRVNNLLTAGSNITLTYDDTANTLTIASTGGITDLSTFDTDDLTEGATNLYYTDERVDDRIASTLTEGSNITLTYDDAANTLTIAATQATSVGEVIYTAVNKEGVALDKGTPVYAKTGTTSGQSVEVGAADASDSAKMPAIGVLNEDLAIDGEGELLLFGHIQGIDTQTPGFSVGDVIYVADGGGFDNTPPTGEGNIIQNLGIVSKVHLTNGGGLVEGSGRGAATPNLNDGKIFIGNASNQSTTATLDTSIVPENTNLYYTTTRHNADFDTRLATKNTGDLTEGSNLYYTDERVDDRANALIQAGTGITKSYDDAANTLTIASSITQYTDADARSALSGGTGITYTSATGSIAVDTSTIATQSYVDTSISNLVDTAPATLDTLNELAAALGDDPNFSTTITNSLATKTELDDFSITTAAEGETSSLTYDNTTGVFTFTPVSVADLIALDDIGVISNAASGNGSLTYDNTTGAFTFTPADVPTTLTDLGITDGTNGQILSTNGAGVFTFVDDAGGIALTDLSITTGSVGETSSLSYNNTTGVFTFTPVDTTDLIGLTDIGVSTAAASGNGSLSYNNTTGVFTFTPADVPTVLTDLGIVDGSSGQVLTTDGAGNFSFAAVSSSGGISNVVEDTTPQLGGALDVNGNSIVSANNGDITLAPNGTGEIILNADVAVGTLYAGNPLNNLTSITMDGAEISINAGTGSVDIQGITIDNGEISVSTGTLDISTPLNQNLSLNTSGTGNVVIDGQKFPNADGTNGQVITTDGAGNLSYTTISTGLSTDTSPSLAGDLDVNGNSIISSNNGDINLTANGTGLINLNSDTVIDGLLDANDSFLINDTQANGFALVSTGSNTTTLGLMVNENALLENIQVAPGGGISLNTQGNGLTVGDLDYPDTDGTSGQVLTTDGAGTLSFTTISGGSSEVVDDTTPTLGGDLDTADNLIVNSSGSETLHLQKVGNVGIHLDSRTVVVGEAPTNQYGTAFITTRDLYHNTNNTATADIVIGPDKTTQNYIKIFDGTTSSADIDIVSQGEIRMTAGNGVYDMSGSASLARIELGTDTLIDDWSGSRFEIRNNNRIELDTPLVLLDNSGGAMISTDTGQDLFLATNNRSYDPSIDDISSKSDAYIRIYSSQRIDIGTDYTYFGDSNSAATLTTNGAHDMILRTNGTATSGFIKIIDGSSGDIEITPQRVADITRLKPDVSYPYQQQGVWGGLPTAYESGQVAIGFVQNTPYWFVYNGSNWVQM